MPRTTSPWKKTERSARGGARFFWRGLGAPGRLTDPRNWSRRPAGRVGVVPPPGATVVFDGRSGRAETVRVPQGYWGLETRRVRIAGFEDGYVVIRLGEAAVESARKRAWARLRDEASAFAARRAATRERRRARRVCAPVESKRYEAVPEIRVVAPWLRGLDLTRELAERRMQAVRDLRTGVVFIVPRVSGAATITALPGGGNWSSSGTWSGGVVPGISDDVQLGATSGSVTVDVNAFCRSLDCNGYAATLTHPAAVTLIVGDAVAGPGNLALRMSATMTYTPGDPTTSIIALVSAAAGTQTVTTAGISLASLDFGGAATSGKFVGRSTWQLQDAFTCTGTIRLMAGTLDTASRACSWGKFTTFHYSARTFKPGSSAITLTGTVAIWTGPLQGTGSDTNFTITANTAVVTTAVSGISLDLGSTNWNGMSFVVNSAGACTISESGWTVQNFTYAPGATQTATLRLGSSGSSDLKGSGTVAGNLTITAASATQRPLVFSNVLGGASTLTVNGTVSATNVDWRDVTGAGSASWNLSAQASGDCGGNSGISFTAPAQQTATASASWSWSDATKWTSRIPLPQDNVKVSIVAGTPTVTLDMARLGANIDCSGTTVAAVLSFASQATAMFGNWTIPAAMANTTGTQAHTLSGRGAQTISIAKTISASFTVSTTGTYTLSANLTSTSDISLSQGTLVDGGKTVSVAHFLCSATNTRAATLTGAWTCTSTGNVWNVVTTGLTFSGASVSVTLSSTSATARTFIGAGLTYGTLAMTSSGAGALAITGNNTFSTLNLQCTTARTVTLPALGNQTVTTALTLQGAAAQLLSVVSATPGKRTTITLGGAATYTHSNTSISADVAVGVYTSVVTTVAAPLEATAGKRMPRTITIPTEIPNGLMPSAAGTVVAVVRPAFPSTDAGVYVVLCLDDGTTANQLFLGWAGLASVASQWNFQKNGTAGIGSATNSARHEVFAAGDTLFLAGSWDANNDGLSFNGDAAFRAVNQQVLAATATHLRIGTNQLGQDFSGTIVWLAIFSTVLTDADVATLYSEFVTTYPSWGDLPASATMLYRSDRGAYVTGEGQTGIEPVEAQQGVVRTASEPLEATGAVSATATQPLEALLGVLRARILPLEATQGVRQTGVVPLEATGAAAAATATLPVEATGAAAKTSSLPVEAAAAVAAKSSLLPVEALRGLPPTTAIEPLEGLRSVAEERDLPWEARGSQRGVAVGRTVKTSVAEGSTV